MLREEFARQLKELGETLFSASVKYAIWLELWPTEERVGTLNRYGGFFLPVRHALYSTMLMEFAKMFDRDQRTISLTNLLQIGKTDPENLLPHAAPVELEQMSQRLSQNESVLESLKRKRDQQLAHLDPNPMEAPLIKGEFDRFVENLQSTFNELFRMHNMSGYGWTYQQELSIRNTTEVLRILG